MPTPLDTILVPAVQNILATYGVDGTVEEARSGFDVRAGEPIGSVTRTSVKVSPPAPVASTYLDDALDKLESRSPIELTDSVVWIAGADLTGPPDTSGKLVVNGIRFSIVAVNRYFSGEQTAAYECIVRA